MKRPSFLSSIGLSILFIGLNACGVFPWRTAMTPGTTKSPAPALAPLDPQKILDQDDMTWSDYHPIPGVNWATTSHTATVRTIRIALVLADFDDQPFVITLPKHSDLFGNPQLDPVKREAVARFYADFWNKPGAINHGRTVNEYWMEQSHGKYGVTFDPYGPYHMPKKMTEYSGTDNANGGWQGRRAGGASLERDVDAMWRKDAGSKTYDLVLRVYAGYDETCLWQEFGEMKFQTKNDIAPAFGNPNPAQPRWTSTRYIDWTSWKAASYLWSNSSIINGESSGSIRHEISHAAFAIGDNNNNPYVQPYHRAGSGPWDIMDRGSFNGPAGPHHRYAVPVLEGGAMPAGLMLSQLLKFGFVAPANVLRLNRNGLAKSGLVVAKVIPREIEPGAASLAGLVVQLDGDAPADRTTVEDPNTHPLYGGSNYTYYSMEVVQQIGYDSFTPDSGVLLALNTGAPAPQQRGIGARGGAPGGAPATPSAVPPATPPARPVSAQSAPAVRPADAGQPGARGAQAGAAAGAAGGRGGFGGAGARGASIGGVYYFNWVIDAHPEDINKLDFLRPNGEPVMRTIADYRQLNDALFHAGLNSGSQFEYVDAPNRLHFYVIDLQKDARGVRTYTLGVRSLDGAGPQQRAVALGAPAGQRVRTPNTALAFTLRNTGTAAATDPALHAQDASAFLGSDIYRLTAWVDAPGWSVQLSNALAAVKFGDSQAVTVYVSRAAGCAPAAKVTLKAVSESDPSKTVTATCTVLK